MKLVRRFLSVAGIGLLACLFLTNPASADFVFDFGRTDDTAMGGGVSVGNINNIGGTAAAPNTSFGSDQVAVAPEPTNVGVQLFPTGLVDNTGASSGFGMIVDDFGSNAGTGADFSGTVPALFSSFPATATIDSVFIDGGVGVVDPTDRANVNSFIFRLTGATGFVIDVDFFGGRSNNGGETFVYVNEVVDGGGNVTSLDASGSYLVFGAAMADDQALSFNGLQANGAGDIEFRITTSGLQGAINAMRITTRPIPEPTTTGLLGFAAITCVFRRRR